MTRLIIFVLCLLAGVVACGSSDTGATSDTGDTSSPSASFDAVATWNYDQAASTAAPGNAGHDEALAGLVDANISFTLAADGSAIVSDGGPPTEGSYAVGDGTVDITADGDTVTFTIREPHLTIPNPNSDTGMPLFYFSKQP